MAYVLVAGVSGCRPSQKPAPVTLPPPDSAQESWDDAQASKLPVGIDTMSGREMYLALCSGCHGEEGDGRGTSRQYVWPLPRNLRRDKFRLVNTHNRVPTLATVKSVIRDGLPGTAMASFGELNDQQQTLLAEEVLQLRRAGVREQVLERHATDGSPVTDEEVEAIVNAAMTPGEVVMVPVIGAADGQTVERGKQIYRKQSCHSCHGDDGVGAWDVRLRNDEGRETRPRDLVHEHFKGGNEPESIYLRLYLGMPGTPHPASTNLSERDLIDLVHYCRSLSKQPKRTLPGYAARAQANTRSYLKALGRAEPAKSR